VSTTLTEKHPSPWYRQGWPWFLIALPATAVVAGIITLIIAARTFDGMVVDDYYKEGRAIVQTLDRVERASTLGLVADLKVRSESVRIELSALHADDLPERAILTVIHPTRDGQDQEIIMTGSGGVYEGRLAPLSTGRWLFQLEDESRSWRMNGAAYLPTETEIRIDPSSS
jgi:hypothetical protein